MILYGKYIDEDCITNFFYKENWIVHSVYKNTINILGNKNGFFTIVNDLQDVLPQSVILYGNTNEFCLVEQNQKVIFKQNQIVIGNVLIDFSKAIGVNTRIYNEYGKINIALQNQNILSSILDEINNYKSNDIWDDNIKQKQNNFLRAVIINDSNYIDKSIKEMIGFGYGLTPSCDDFLTGFICSEIYFNTLSKKVFENIKSSILNYIENTTFISKQMLLLALNQKCRLSLKLLLDCLNYFDTESIKTNTKQVLKIGSSSGKDLCDGIIGLLKINRGEQFV